MSLVQLPEGLSSSRWAAAVKAFESALGADAVFVEELDRNTYDDQFSVHPARHKPLGGIAPQTVEQVQSAIRIASEYRVPLWPVSRGKNLGYGGSAPLMSGSVVLDLSRMKAIELDEENGTVLVEPGVSFYDLYDYLQQRGSKLWLSVPANSWGSVAGNALDRGTGNTPYGDHASKVCGLEVVLPDGDVVRTGTGAMRNSATWQLYRYGFGPCWEQMFIQSNLGVVTKLGLWLMPEPETVLGLNVEFDRPDDIGPLVDALGPLRREGVLRQGTSIGNWLRAAAVFTQRSEWTDQPGALSEDVITAIRRKYNIGWWGASLRVYGREAMTKAAMQVIEPALAAIQPMSLERTQWRQGEPPEPSGLSGTPNTFLMQNANWHGGQGGHIGFSPVLPQSGKEALAQFHRTYSLCQQFGFDYQGSFNLGERHLFNVNIILFDKSNDEMLAKVDPYMKALIDDAKKQGYGEYRAHLDHMGAVAETYDFNDHALRRLNERTKKLIDPLGIIAPGKNGIWPPSYSKDSER